MKNYDKYMRMCFKLAKKGEGKTSPNPLVGCVVLDKDNNLISTGYHKKYGDNHAERDALLKLKNGEEIGGTLIVNLEPCNHHGKTPPCSDLIIERRIKKVVISCKDINPVAIGGVEKLRSAGIEVIDGVLEEEGKKLNEVFFTNIREKRPFIALKTATTIDGKIATSSGDSKWITSDKARSYGKKLRLNYDAILTSSSTILEDNPCMKHKIKIVIDRYLKCDLSADIFKNGKIYVFTQTQPLERYNNTNIEYIFNSTITLKFVLDELFKRKVMSVFVEAGGKLLGNFVKQGYYDKIYHFVAPKIVNDNSAKSCFDGDKIDLISQVQKLNIVSVKKLVPDILVEYDKQ